MRRVTSLAILVSLAAASMASAASIFSDDFESPAITTAYQEFTSLAENPSSTTYTMGVWTVTSGSVDIINSTFAGTAYSPTPYPSPVQAVDLNGNENGSIETTISTTPGDSYLLSFYLAGNQTITASTSAAAGATSNTFSSGDDKWRQYSMPFTASSSSTIISFTSLAPAGTSGPTLDSVEVDTVPTPASAMGGAALLGLVYVGNKFRTRRV